MHLISVSVQYQIHAMTTKIRLASEFSSEEDKTMWHNCYANIHHISLMYLNFFYTHNLWGNVHYKVIHLLLLFYTWECISWHNIYYWVALDPSNEELHHMLGKHLAPHPGLWTSRTAMKENAHQ